jgi:hypothetical protein
MNSATTHRHEPTFTPTSPPALLRRALRRIAGTALLLLVMALAHELAAPAPLGQAAAPASTGHEMALSPGTVDDRS